MTLPSLDIARLTRASGETLAFVRAAGAPGRANLLWLGGFRSDMGGTKAMRLDAWARRTGRTLVRFDYTGHGESAGRFEDATIGVWRDDALAVLDAKTSGPQILIGSSMGAWIALLAARARPERVAGLVLIAPAADFTERLMWPKLTAAQRDAVTRTGRASLPSGYDDGDYVVTRALFEDGRRWRVLDAPIPAPFPVRILQGRLDPDVPWTHAVDTFEAFSGDDIELTLIKAGDHRLSTPVDLDRLEAVVDALATHVEAR